MKKLVVAAAFTAALLSSAAAYANADTRSVLAHANATVTDLKVDPVFGGARDTIRHARAVLIVPALVKGGFIFGAEGGDGVLLARTRHGWSDPAFYSLGSASFGPPVGLEHSHLVVIIL